MKDIVFYFVGDLIRNIASNLNFNMVRSGKGHFAAKLISAGFIPIGYLSPIPWLIVLLMQIPGISGPWSRAVEWSRQEIVRRMKVSYYPISLLLTKYI